MPVSLNRFNSRDDVISDYIWSKKLEYVPVFKLDDNRSVAMQKIAEMEKLASSLPGIDCGLCGAPSCRAFAEDVVRGDVSINQCVRRDSGDESSKTDKN